MPEYISTRSEGHILFVTINRPSVLNAVHAMANKELEDAFDIFSADPTLWVAVITGAGDKAFCAGNDLKFTASLPKHQWPAQPRTGWGGLTHRFDLNKPVIAAVNGVAMGGGFEIALCCDLIVASDNAVFALPEPLVGLAAIAGGVHRLTRMIPVKHAMGILLTGRRVTAQEGKEIGFVNEVVAPHELMRAARSWAEQIMRCSPMSIRATKEMANLGSEHSVETAINIDYPALRDLKQCPDYIEGPRAFAEKREPKWQGM